MNDKLRKKLSVHVEALKALAVEEGVKEVSIQVGEDENFEPVYLVYEVERNRFIIRCGKKSKSPDDMATVIKALDNVKYEYGDRYGK